MGQAQPLLTPATQQLNLAQSQVASALGAATFTFAAPPTGTWWTGTLTCPGAPNAAIFSAAIGATPWGSWAGNSIAGPVQAQGQQQLVVTAVGLTPGATYELEWIGSSDAEGNIQPIWPDTNASSVTASIAGPVTVSGTVNATVTNNVTVTPSGTINVQGVAGGTTIGIAGAVTVTSGSVNIGSIAGTVNIAGNVGVSSVSGTVTVAGTVNVGTVSGTVNVAGTVNVGTISGSVTIASGTVNVGTVAGNITVQQVVQAVAVLTDVTSLLDTSHTFTLGSNFTPALAAAAAPFEGLRLALQNSSLVQDQHFTLTMQNTTNGQTFIAAVTAPTQSANPPWHFFAIPIAADVGDALTFKLTNIDNPGACLVRLVQLAGNPVTASAPGQPLAVYNVGGSQALASVVTPSNVATQILPAPPGGMVYRLHRYGIAIGTGFTAYTAFVMGIESGAGAPYDAQTVVYPAAATAAGAGQPLQGQLTEPGAAVNVTQIGLVGATATMWVRYDLVAAQSVQ